MRRGDAAATTSTSASYPKRERSDRKERSVRNPVFRRHKWYIYIDQLDGRPPKQTKTKFTEDQHKQARELQAKLNDQVAAQRALLQAENLTLDIKSLTARTWLRIWGKRRRDNERLESGNKDETRILRYAIPFLPADLLLTAVRPVHLQHVSKELHKLYDEGKLSSKYIRDTWINIKQALKSARARDLISHDPCVLDEDSPLPPIGHRDPMRHSSHYYTKQQSEVLISHAALPLHRRMVYAFLLFTGGRFSELTVLRWRDYDPDTEYLGKILVHKAYSVRRKQEKNKTKTGAVREVPIHPVLARMLAEWKIRGWEQLTGHAPRLEDLIFPAPPTIESFRFIRDPQLVQQVAALHAKGGSRRSIGRELGITEDVTRGIIYSLGSPRARGVPGKAPQRPFVHGEYRVVNSEARWLKRNLERLTGVPYKHGVHVFRHTLITLATDNDADPRAIEVITHTPADPRKAFEKYRHYTWKKRCEAISRFPVELRYEEEETLPPGGGSH
jgi:hypothetical protein